jgi:hypothetical protein
VYALGEGYFATPVRGVGRGYLQRRADDCLQVSLATLAQIRPQQVPDLGIDRMRMAGIEPEEIERRTTEALEQWQMRNGVWIAIHPTPPWSAKLWIGVVPSTAEYSDHCLLMRGHDVVFDPSQALPGQEFAFTADEVDYGITIERS